MIPKEKLGNIEKRFEYLEAKIADGLSGTEVASIGKEYSELRPVIAQIKKYNLLLSEIGETEEMLNEPDVRNLAEEELSELKKQLQKVEKNLQISLLPKDLTDSRSAILEIRPGTGGEEAALFAAVLLRMYQKYSEAKRWRFEIIEESQTGLGGIKEVIVNVKGDNVFGRLKYESGVHRVQRVPETESGGRIHTSAATVAVLAEAQDVDIHIASEDLRIDTMRSSGAGGQHVNTTDSAVRITHIPSGIVVTSSEKSQHRNREIALNVLKSRLFDQERQKLEKERSKDRKSQVGSGDRSERIRTYNFPQGRITDHRINITLYKLDQIIQGDLEEIIDALIADAQAALLSEFQE